jgi:hypothetical protein
MGNSGRRRLSGDPPGRLIRPVSTVAWDVDYEQLSGVQVIATGARAFDLASFMATMGRVRQRSNPVQARLERIALSCLSEGSDASSR